MKKISTIIQKIEKRKKGDYLVFLKKGLAWKYYKELTPLTSRRGM